MKRFHSLLSALTAVFCVLLMLAAARSPAQTPVYYRLTLAGTNGVQMARASGAVTTNSLFLPMRPEVKAEVAEVAAERTMRRAIASIVSDTRASIPETASLSDVEVAGLYLAQMRKPADGLSRAAATNTLEYLVGAGIRIDLGAIPEPRPESELPDGLKAAALLAAGAAAKRRTA